VGIESPDFVRAQPPPLTLSQLAQRQRSDRHPDQAQHIETQRRQQAADVPVATFIQHHFQPRILLADTQQRRSPRLQQIARIVDARLHRCQRCRIRLAGYLYVVGLVQVRGRVGDSRRPGSVVAQQQQTFAGLVQSTDRSQPRQSGGGQRGINRSAPLLVGCADHQPTRLVECDMDAFGGFHRLAVDRNLLAVDQRRMIRIAHDTPIQTDAAGTYPLLGLTARTGAQLGQDARQTMSRRMWHERSGTR
jgi:hypothetical protein